MFQSKGQQTFSIKSFSGQEEKSRILYKYLHTKREQIYTNFLLMRFKTVIIEYKFCNPGLMRILLDGVTLLFTGFEGCVPYHQIDSRYSAVKTILKFRKTVWVALACLPQLLTDVLEYKGLLQSSSSEVRVVSQGHTVIQ